ncbi:protein kinase [Streptomyces sp. STR69]|uniref:protein kinase n=1 Tax=Streptomyces sp. STR69 TaxID=1796942 RepID=UPI0021C927F7|nr:protein kinase [Streptomyces sp. STR69]
MDDYAGRVLADRYRLPLPPSDEYELTETRAFDTYSGQEVLVRQVPLPEVVEAEVLGEDGLPDGFTARDRGARRPSAARTATRRPTDPAVRRAVEAAQAAARIPDHPRLDQVFDVFAEGGSLWIVSELVSAQPLSALLVEKPLSPYRAAEVAADVLMALRVLHAHGWVHRNITARTVLVCDDGRVMLTGLAVGAAEEALCGYDPVPPQDGEAEGGSGHPGHTAHHGGATAPATPRVPTGSTAPAASTTPAIPGDFRGAGTGAGAAGGVAGTGAAGGGAIGFGGAVGGPGVAGHGVGPGGAGRAVAPAAAGHDEGPGASNRAVSPGGVDPEAARRAAIEARAAGGLPGVGVESGGGSGASAALARREVDTGGDVRAARAGAIAAYRAGARAAARVQETQQPGRPALPGARPAAEGENSGAQTGGSAALPSPQPPYAGGRGVEHTGGSTTPPGQIADPYGVRNTPSWHGAAPRPAAPSPTDTFTGADTSAHGAARTTTGQPNTAPTGAPYFPGQPPAGTGNPHAPGLSKPVPPTAATVPAPDNSPQPHPYSQPHSQTPARWDELAAAGAPVRRGPATALAAERARQVRMTVVGPVTERWAPEQAVPVHENWQLAAPIGPATDLWALGALLFRAVQGHAPYPEEATAELVQLVCAEPPAFAEECGPLRPVVESLLRQDPTERLDFEELRGWLRSLVRSAPEPEAGAHVVATPPTDPRRLPIVRRRGELVRRRRAGLPATSPHGRHKRAKQEVEGSPRRLGRTLLVLIFLLLAGAVAYAMLFLPKSGEDTGAGQGDRTGAAGDVSPAPSQSSAAASSQPQPDQTSPEASDSASNTPSQPAGSTGTQTGSNVADGFVLRKDSVGFQVAVAKGWTRTPKNGSGQVVYSHGDFELIVVAGRDSATKYGSDPMVYQRDTERELQPYRDSSWATATGLRTITVGAKTMAEGQFTWTDSQGGDLFVRNMVFLIDGRYHIVQIRGPEAQRDEVTRLYEQASSTYQYTG